MDDIPTVPVRDNLLLKEHDDTAVYVVHGGAKFHVNNKKEVNLFGGWGAVRKIPSNRIEQVPDIPIRDNLLVKEHGDGSVFVVHGGAKFWISSGDELEAVPEWGGWSAVRTLPAGLMGQIPDIPVRDNLLLKQHDATTVYVVQGGAKFRINSAQELVSLPDWGGWSAVRLIPSGAIEQLPDVPVRDNLLLRELDENPVHVAHQGAKFHFPSAETFVEMGYSWGSVRRIPDGRFAQIPDIPSDMTLVRVWNQTAVYVMLRGERHWINVPHCSRRSDSKWRT
jgi:hypothetical protein